MSNTKDKKSKIGQMKTLRKVLHYLKRYKALVFLSAGLSLISVASALVMPLLIGEAIDCIVGVSAVDFSRIGQILVQCAILVAIGALAQWLFNVCNNKITFFVSKDVREAAFEKIQKLPFSYLDSHAHGDIVSRVISDVDTFADGLLMGCTQLFSGVLTIVGTLVFLLLTNVTIAAVVVLLTPVSLFVARFIATRTYNMFSLQSQTKGEQTALIQEGIGQIKNVKAFAQEEKMISRFDEINDRLRECSLKAVFFSSIVNPSTRFVNALVYAGVGLTGAFLAIRGGISVGVLSSCLSYANQYTKPFNEISGVVTELQNAIACAERVFELIEEKNTVDAFKNAGEAEVLQPKETEKKVFEGRVDFENVAFSYDKEKKLIEDFDLHVKEGQRIAIVGPTGCGKTTMINLLMRFYEVDEGQIKIDGVPSVEIQKKDLRGSIGMVLQDTWLKSGTVRENIAYGKPEATMEEVEEAARKAHAHSFIKRLPNGYDTILSEDGGNLSAGQKQLLCIARIMLTMPPMLILDEATSSIDTRTEMKIQEAFKTLMQGRTSFIVAHRLSTIREADCIVAMKDGKIMETGTHKELLSKGGFYAKLYNSQFDSPSTDMVSL